MTWTLSTSSSRWLACVLISWTLYTSNLICQPGKTSDSRIKFLNSVAALPFEYRADLILTAAEMDPSLLKSTQIQARVREVFDDAKLARHPYAEVLAARAESDSAESQLSGAQKTEKLDGLDITVRALKLLVQVDPHHVYRDVLTVHVDAPISGCTDAYAYNVAPYYEFVAANAATWLKAGVAAPKLRQDMETHMLNSLTPASISAVTHLIASMPLDRSNIEVLATELTSRESRLTITDRELGFLLADGNLLSNTELLAARLDNAGLSSYQLLAALKTLLLSGTKTRCADSLFRSVETVKAYNALVAKHQPTANELRLEEDALKGIKSGIKAALHPVDPKGPEDSAIKVAQRYAQRANKNPDIGDIPGWDAASDSLLHTIAYEVPQGDCDTCNFYAKSEAYYLLEEYSADVPLSYAKERALRAYAGFLVSSRAANIDPIAWLAQLKLLMNLSRQPDIDVKRRIDGLRSHGYYLMGLPSPSGVEVVHEMERSGDKVVRAYIELDRQFHTLYQSPY